MNVRNLVSVGLLSILSCLGMGDLNEESNFQDHMECVNDDSASIIKRLKENAPCLNSFTLYEHKYGREIKEDLLKEIVDLPKLKKLYLGTPLTHLGQLIFLSQLSELEELTIHYRFEEKDVLKGLCYFVKTNGFQLVKKLRLGIDWNSFQAESFWHILPQMFPNLLELEIFNEEGMFRFPPLYHNKIESNYFVQIERVLPEGLRSDSQLIESLVELRKKLTELKD